MLHGILQNIFKRLVILHVEALVCVAVLSPSSRHAPGRHDRERGVAGALVIVIASRPLVDCEVNLARNHTLHGMLTLSKMGDPCASIFLHRGVAVPTAT
jgi:hypothetical protein